MNIHRAIQVLKGTFESESEADKVEAGKIAASKIEEQWLEISDLKREISNLKHRALHASPRAKRSW